MLLELGVGFNTPDIVNLRAPFEQWCTKIENTPIIIRFPFEKLVRQQVLYSLIRLNKDEAVVPESFGKRAVGIGGDMAHAIADIRRSLS